MWIKTYVNGGVGVIVKYDGTKIRYIDGPPELPESIDLKITDYCDAGCLYCHESSTTRGKHGNTDTILEIIDQMIPGTELAIGGGNPLSHPDIVEILSYCKEKGVIANITVNEFHLDDLLSDESWNIRCNIEGGIGISLSKNPNIDKLKQLNDGHRHVVFHLIHRVHKESLCLLLAKKFEIPKVLILGYKEFGFGVKYKKDNDINLNEYYLGRNSCGLAFTNKYLRRSIDFSFDNLALEQLNVKDWMIKNEWMSQEEWNKRYMGDDGKFTMYIDAVKKHFAVSSTSPRNKWVGDLKEAFNCVRKGI